MFWIRIRRYEPSGGSAPDIAGKNISNPAAQILCAAMMLRYSFEAPEAASAIEAAVQATIDAGVCTGDVASPGQKACSTIEFGDAVTDRIRQ